MDDQRTKTFAMAKFKLTIPDPKGTPTRLPLDSFELREVTGEDMVAAAERTGNASNMSLRDSMVAEAFISVNGESVAAPFVGWRKWSAKARDFVVLAYTKMNDASEADLADFEKAAFGPSVLPKDTGRG